MTTCGFETVVGHRKQCAHLRDLLKRESVPHAMLFSGISCVGKLTVARAFAAELLTTRGSSTAEITAEGLKRLFIAGNHPDFHLLEREEGKEDLAVEQVRELISSLSLKSYYGNSIVAVINDAHLMSIAACNALLKTLEEPSSGTFIILVSDAPHKLPETVLSRCQNIKFGELSSGEVKRVLEKIFALTEISAVSADECVEICSGSLAALGLSKFFDARTAALKDQDHLQEHLDSVVERAKVYEEKFSYLLSSAAKTNFPLILASQFLEEEELDALLWRSLFATIRKKLSSGADEEFLGELLFEVADTYQMIYERNANKDLALSELFLKCSRIG